MLILENKFVFAQMRIHCGLAGTNLVRVLWNLNFRQFCFLFLFRFANIMNVLFAESARSVWMAREKKNKFIMKARTSSQRMQQSIKWAKMYRANANRNNELKQNVTFKCPFATEFRFRMKKKKVQTKFIMVLSRPVNLAAGMSARRREDEWNE